MEVKEGYYNGYKVFSNGRIFNRKGKELIQGITNQGYLCVSISINKVSYYKRVHRIVAETFIPNPENKKYVNHLDRNRANPNVENLEWCTQSENIIHSVKNGGRANWTRNNTGERNANSKLSWEVICAIRDLYKTGKYSQDKLSRIFNIGQGRISKIVNFKIWVSQN